MIVMTDNTARPTIGRHPTSPELLRLIEAARTYVMTSSEKRAQARSWVRGMTGATDDDIRKHCPEMFDE